MMNKPLVSIIIPIYKVEKYITATIQSVIDQTYDNIELILVDDGTPDKSAEIAEETLSKNQFLYQIIHQENAGLGMARNAGLDVAKGDWVFFLDSDDLIVPSAIEHMVRASQEDNVDIVFSDYHVFFSSTPKLPSCQFGKRVFFSQQELQLSFLLRTVVILAPGTLYRRQFLVDYELRFENIPWSEDQFFIWRMLRYISKAIYLREPLYQYRRRDGSIMTSSTADKMLSSYQKICYLQDVYVNETPIGRLLVPRWVMGTINAASGLMCFDEWERLLVQIDSDKHFRWLLKFPQARVKILSCIGLFSHHLYYVIVKRRLNNL